MACISRPIQLDLTGVSGYNACFVFAIVVLAEVTYGGTTAH
jgi:hypothetical protein